MLQKYLLLAYLSWRNSVCAKWALKMDWMNVTISSLSLQSEEKLEESDMEDRQEFCKAIRLEKTDLLQIAQKLYRTFHNLLDCETGSRTNIPIF